ncbi:transposable element Tcb2 transposase [Trichonephila clavipes]|nr:transposable element Tcb2 transposase [Trichonephila clavipes]
MSVGCLVLVIIEEIGEILKWYIDQIMVEMIIGVAIRTTVKEINLDFSRGDQRNRGSSENFSRGSRKQMGRLNVLKVNDIKGDQTQSINQSQIKLSAICMSPVELPYVPILLDETFTKVLWDTGAENKPGLTQVLYHEIDTGDNPPVVSRPYRYDRLKQEILDYHVDKMLKDGTIIPIQSHSLVSSPVVLCRKNNGLPPDNPEAYRFAVDYRKLNSITKYPRYPLPLIDDLIMNVPHTGIMSALDLQSGYFQMAVNPSDIVKTAFVTKNGTYAFRRMPFGLSGGGPNFSESYRYNSQTRDRQEPLRRNRRQYEQLTDFDRGRIIGLREAGWSNRRIGRHLGRSDMVVARCWQQWITEGRVYRRGGSGRPRNTNDREDRAIRRVATSAPTTSLASIQRHLPPSRHPVPSRETIRRRLTEVGLMSRRPLRRLPLTPHHRQCRLDFCRPRATWSVTDWRRVIFSDESRFSLSADDHRTRVWRRTGQRSDPAFIVERHTAISQGVTVWGAISWDTRSSLVVLQGTLTARRYVDDILTPIVLPMLSSRPGAIYQQDNARPHTARLSQQCLQGYDVLPWPARTPDLSPIEHVWTRWEVNCSRPEIQEN